MLTSWNSLSASDQLLIFATFLGPILAVLATRLLDVWRARSERRSNIFASLMVTRRAQTTWPHVEALNRIEIEFSRDTKVMAAFNVYMGILNEPGVATREQIEHWVHRKDRAFAGLIQALSSKIGFRLDKSDFLEGGYQPKRWVDDEETTRETLLYARALLQRIATGDSTLVFNVKSIGGQAAPNIPQPPFPPPPADRI